MGGGYRRQLRGVGLRPPRQSRPPQLNTLTKETIMHRHNVNKRQSANKFKRNTSKTKAINLAPAPMRGGIRL
ncbi:MAG: hypothetical protein [Microvirus sp.]|nr:MAG: hypothetical protein [Microvirus sp.]